MLTFDFIWWLLINEPYVQQEVYHLTENPFTARTTQMSLHCISSTSFVFCSQGAAYKWRYMKSCRKWPHPPITFGDFLVMFWSSTVVTMDLPAYHLQSSNVTLLNFDQNSSNLVELGLIQSNLVKSGQIWGIWKFGKSGGNQRKS